MVGIKDPFDQLKLPFDVLSVYTGFQRSLTV